jgi:hypothetical protein
VVFLRAVYSGIPVTESEAMEDPELTMDLVHGLRESGVRVASEDLNSTARPGRGTFPLVAQPRWFPAPPG